MTITRCSVWTSTGTFILYFLWKFLYIPGYFSIPFLQNMYIFLVGTSTAFNLKSCFIQPLVRIHVVPGNKNVAYSSHSNSDNGTLLFWHKQKLYFKWNSRILWCQPPCFILTASNTTGQFQLGWTFLQSPGATGKYKSLNQKISHHFKGQRAVNVNDQTSSCLPLYF